MAGTTWTTEGTGTVVDGSGSAPSFGDELFRGRLRLDLLLDGPGWMLTPGEKAFLGRLRAFCERKVDARRIEREDRIPDEVVTGLADLGALAVKLPVEYGGLGFSGPCYHRALMIASSAHSALGELLAAHQSIGLTQPLLLFGTDEQKRALLPRCVQEVSAFALTEPDIGNDPFRMRVSATRSGSGYRLNGVKLWVTGGVHADLLVVLAMVPASDHGPGGMTAFVVEADAPGVTVEHHCSFLGLRGLGNGVIRLHDVAASADRRIGPEGQGLEVALAAQETGRLSLPSVCAAAAKWSLKVAREWSLVRVQWDRPIGEHEAVAAKIARIAATAFALEAVVEVSGGHAAAGGQCTRTEAELAKLFASEHAWLLADELVQIRGGRGYETAESAIARGERGVPVEQLLRDLRVGRIFDGTTEALRGFIADGALSPESPSSESVSRDSRFPVPVPGPLAEHMAAGQVTAHELARHLAAARDRWGEAVGERQMVLGRLVDIAAELYVQSAACVHATRLDGSAVELADAFCRQSRVRVAELFTRVETNTDEGDRALAARVLDERYAWLEDGVVDAATEGPWIAEVVPGPATARNRRKPIRRS